MALPSQLVLSQKTEERTGKKQPEKQEIYLNGYSTKTHKAWGLFIHSFKDPSSD